MQAAERCSTCRFWINPHSRASRTDEGVCGLLSDEIFSEAEPTTIRFVNVAGHVVLTTRAFGCSEHVTRTHTDGA
jgi:hypothetical protein